MTFVNKTTKITKLYLTVGSATFVNETLFYNGEAVIYYVAFLHETWAPRKLF